MSEEKNWLRWNETSSTAEKINRPASACRRWRRRVVRRTLSNSATMEACAGIDQREVTVRASASVGSNSAPPAIQDEAQAKAGLASTCMAT